MSQENELFESNKEIADFIKCQSCGGNMVFDPESQMLYCSHCGSKLEFEKNREVAEIAIEQAFEATEKWDDTAILRCENCGANVTVDRSAVALECPYCGTSHIKKTDEISGVKPSALYPFTIKMEDAEAIAKKWAKSRLFSPRKFKKELTARDPRGVFQPCFTFDSCSFTSYKGRIGERRTRTVRTKNGVSTQTYIAWKRVSGSISLNFDDITITASNSIDQKKLSQIMPFNQKSICVYEKKYLAGFYANHYDKDIKTSWLEAKNVMNSEIKQAILRKHNCDVVDYLNISTSHSNVTYKYVLLPIYVMNYRYKKKNYEVNVNGNTGRVVGKAPVSFLRVLLAVALGGACLFGLWKLFESGSSDFAKYIVDGAKALLRKF